MPCILFILFENRMESNFEWIEFFLFCKPTVKKEILVVLVASTLFVCFSVNKTLEP